MHQVRYRGARQSRPPLRCRCQPSFSRTWRPSADVVAQLVKRAADENAAFMRGDMDRWFRLAHIAPDFTLMQPFGGPASHGFDASPERLAELAQFFKNGETSLEVAQTYASDRLVVLVMIERQQAEVGGLPRPRLVAPRNRGVSQGRL